MTFSRVSTPFAGYGPGLVPTVVGEQNMVEQGTPTGDWPSVLSPRNPLFYVFLLAGTTLGLIAVSGSVKLGRTKVSGAIGSTS